MDSDTIEFGPIDPGPGGQRRPPRWSGRKKRLLTTAAAGAVLLGSGTAIGIALTGGASASTSSPPVSTATSGASASPSVGPSTGAGTGAGSAARAASLCTRLARELEANNQSKLAARLHALCTRPLLRLALVGGEHGTVTFNGKSGATTALFERGTVQSDTGSSITVTARDGTTWTWDIISSTVIRKAGSQATVGTGDQVFVVGTVVSGANDARLIQIRSTG
jgi:ABC-type transport system substrate-binding protein